MNRLGLLLSLLAVAGCDAAANDPAECLGAKCDSLGEPPAPLADEYDLSVEDLFPEGGTFDPVTRAFYVGSLSRGTVTRVDAGGEETEFFSTKDAERATLGMDADADRRTLWVCTIINEGDKPGAVWQFDLDSGSLEHTYDLTEIFPAASCNDVTTSADGRAYVTDRENPNIYVLDPETHDGRIFLSHDLLAPGLVGSNGIAITPDGETMIVTKYLLPDLLRIPMNNPEQITELSRDGDSLHVFFHALSGADGLAFFGDDLYLAFDAALFRITSETPDWQHATLEKLSDIDTHGGLTTLMVAEGALYGANGQAPTFILGFSPDPAAIWRLNVER